VRTALDSSVLLLLSRKQPGWEAWRDSLQTAASEGQLLISPIAFAAYLAGQIFLRYRRNGGPRLNLIPDFLIAAHASVQADRLAAIDRGYLRSYFPTLSILVPVV
jgi:predicted nucleic acid-binding protein